VLVVYEPACATAPTCRPPPITRGRWSRVNERLRQKGAQRTAVIHGGTVTADNVDRFAVTDMLDGVGATRATLDAHQFVTIVEHAARRGR
jgi:triosephosphate isomerase